MSNNWLEFWQQKNDFDSSMIDNYQYFLSKVEKYVQPKIDSKVLDIGSGPGHLEDAWHNRVLEIQGLDVSERYNQIAAQKHINNINITFNKLEADDYLNFDVLRNKKFDIIIVMSVLQYYKNKNEVKQLLNNIKKLAAPQSTILLCDLIVNEGMLKDLISVLYQSIKSGTFFSTIIFFFKLRFSKYYFIKKTQGFLVIKETEWIQLCADLSLNATFINEPITLQQDRKTLLIRTP